LISVTGAAVPFLQDRHCDREPIHVPGAIQPHGAFLAALADGGLVTHASSNLATILGRPAEAALGQPLHESIGVAASVALHDCRTQGDGVIARFCSLPGPNGLELDLQAHRVGRYILVDIEPAARATEQLLPLAVALSLLETFPRVASQVELCELAARLLKSLTGYDRVIAYRFRQDGCGEVIAEERSGCSLAPVLGQRYPASDIPSRARALYQRQRIGVVADADYEPVPLLADPAHDDGAPLDLTHSALRSVSPIHRAFMRNMLTAASLTIGLVHQEELWGMLVCHHATPRIAGAHIRMAANLIGRAVSMLIGSLGTAERHAEMKGREVILSALVTRLTEPQPLPAILAAAEAELLGLVDAAGAVARIDGTMVQMGQTPPPEVTARLLKRLHALAAGQLLAIEDLGLRLPDFADSIAEASGVLMLPLTNSIDDTILWFRPEQRHTVIWGGDPSDRGHHDPETSQMSPRASLAACERTVTGHSAPWGEPERCMAGRLDTALTVEMQRRMRLELAEQMRLQLAQNAALTLAADALRESEARYRLSEARLERAQEIAAIGSWEVDVATNRYSWSKAMYRMRGIAEYDFDLNADSAADFVHAEDQGAIQTWLANLIAGEVVGAHEFRVIDPHGNVRYFRAQGRPTRDEHGMLCRVEGTSQDVTEQRQIERQLAQVQKLDALGNLTGGMAHDFNNMLGIVIANVEMLQREVPDNEVASELCAEALEGANHCADLIRRLLAFARRQSLRPEPTGVNELVHDIIRLLRRTLGEDITLTLNLEHELWQVIVDPTQLESCLVNLANNARDAMPKGGQLAIATRNTRIDASYLALHSDVTLGEYVAIEVSDSGTGIPPDIIGRIFEPFFTTKGPSQGTGLGLSMAFGFVKQSGGHISVYSEPGLGTTFRVYLPRAATGEVSAPTEAPPEHVVGGHEIVLVVEDNAQLRRAVARQLAELGYRVREADNGESALEILSQGDQIDLLFSDVVIPGTFDGLDLAYRAKALRPDMKILITSGFPGMRGSEPRLVGSPFPLIGKPFSRNHLAQAIRDSLDTAMTV
jgi:PAS domain S-box-containing protein